MFPVDAKGSSPCDYTFTTSASAATAPLPSSSTNTGLMSSSNRFMPLLFFLFFFVGMAYGLGAGVIRKGEDIPKLMQKGIVGSTGFMVVVLPASFFVAPGRDRIPDFLSEENHS